MRGPRPLVPSWRSQIGENPDKLYQVKNICNMLKNTSTSGTGMQDELAESVWDHEVFKQPDPRFGGQQLGVLQTELAKELPWINTGDIFWDAVATDFNTQFVEMVSGNISIERGLAEAQAQALKRLR